MTERPFHAGDLALVRAPIERDGVALASGVIVTVDAVDEAGRLSIVYESTDVGVPRKLHGLAPDLFEMFVPGPRD